MAERVLLQGRIVSVGHHENEVNGTKWDEFTYEFEYNGLRFEDSSKSVEGALAKEALEEGMLIDIWFYPDTQKYKIKRKIFTVSDVDEEGNKVNTSKVTLLGLGLIVLGMFIGALLRMKVFLWLVMGIGFILIGVDNFVNEIKFFIDRNNGKYKIFNALVVDYKRSRDIRSNRYKNVYEYIEDGEVKQYISSGERNRIGYERFIYKNILTGEIKKGTEWKEGLLLFLIAGVLGILFIYVAFL